MNDRRADVYSSLMSLSFERAIERLDQLHKQKALSATPFPIQIGRVQDYSDADNDFTDWVGDHYPAFEVGLIFRGDWAGEVSEDIMMPMAIGCQRWFDLSIASTGKVVLCCMDGKAEHVIGDITTAAALDIYNGAGYRSLRENTLDRTQAAAPCNSCSFI